MPVLDSAGLPVISVLRIAFKGNLPGIDYKAA